MLLQVFHFMADVVVTGIKLSLVSLLPTKNYRRVRYYRRLIIVGVVVAGR